MRNADLATSGRYHWAQAYQRAVTERMDGVSFRHFWIPRKTRWPLLSTTTLATGKHFSVYLAVPFILNDDQRLSSCSLWLDNKRCASTAIFVLDLLLLALMEAEIAVWLLNLSEVSLLR